jgi:23S rRNA pseudouridine1911/1915/1917 synthase
MSVRILYEDAALIVCEKPVGVLSEGEMPALLQQETGCPSVSVVHRLDRGVGGVMVFAKTKESAAALSEAVRSHALRKEYLAVVRGIPAEQSATWTDLLFHDARTNKTYPVRRMRKGVREAILSYEVHATCADESGDLSLVSVQLQTGRTHQIRVQFATHKLPLVGDGRYGGKGGSGIALWSHRLAFPHPKTGEPMEFLLPPPATFPWNLF